jgi:hypothetical protein
VLGRAEPADGRARPRRHGRRDLDDRDRGLTLGGGLGWLMAKHGLAADNLLAVELVTADGEVLEVDAELAPGPLLGAARRRRQLRRRHVAHLPAAPVATVTGGLIAHPIEAGAGMLRFFRDAVASASDDLTVFAALVHAPDGSGTPLAAMIVFHSGTPDEAERELAPFKEWGSPIVVDVGPLPYQVMNTILDAGFPTGSLNYWLSSFTSGLPDELIDVAVERFAAIPSQLSAILFEHFHGAVTRVGVTDTAVPHREEGWNLVLPGVWTDPAETDRNIAWTRETHAALAPHLAAAAGSTTSATTRAATRSATPTARTTTGSSRSSAGATRGTSSARTTTSFRSRGSRRVQQFPGLERHFLPMRSRARRASFRATRVPASFP